uniref:Uncharacterized protein n=1 Tax=Solanum tuberosum TaxID=4113 RepID=M1DY16_SOLTU
MGESKVWESEEIPRQPEQELNAQAIVEAEAAIAQAEAIIAEIERVVTMAEEARRRKLPLRKELNTQSSALH